jgi:polar amino acid transport system substrate-binding protein
MRLGIPSLSAAALSATAALGLAACGSSNSSSTSSTATTASAAGSNSKIAAEVPAAVKSKGTLTVAADATYAPNEFVGPNGKNR